MADTQESADVVAGFSVWAVPEPAAAEELGGVIKTYATRLNTPPFLPHMTVVSGVKGLQAGEAAAKLSQLGNELRVLDVEVETVTFKDELYFQCVFGLLTLTRELVHAHRRAKEIYAVERSDEFMPHVRIGLKPQMEAAGCGKSARSLTKSATGVCSFVYGDLANAERAELAKELRPSLAGRRLKMEKLQLWRTIGPVEMWELVAEAKMRS